MRRAASGGQVATPERTGRVAVGRRRAVFGATSMAALGAATAYVQPFVTDSAPALRGAMVVQRSIEHRGGHVLDLVRARDRLMTMRTAEVLDLGASDSVAAHARRLYGDPDGPDPGWYAQLEPLPRIWTRSGAHRPARWGPGHRRVVEMDSGWPWRSVWCMWSWDTSAHAGPLPPTQTRGVFNVRLGSGRGVSLPSWLIPAGFAGNAAVFALAWGVVLLGLPAAVRAVRRRRRARRGACPGCGYDLRGVPGDTCPECGQAACRGLGREECPPRIERF